MLWENEKKMSENLENVVENKKKKQVIFKSFWKRLTIRLFVFFWYDKGLKSFLVKFKIFRNQTNN